MTGKLQGDREDLAGKVGPESSPAQFLQLFDCLVSAGGGAAGGTDFHSGGYPLIFTTALSKQGLAALQGRLWKLPQLDDQRDREQKGTEREDSVTATPICMQELFLFNL